MPAWIPAQLDLSLKKASAKEIVDSMKTFVRLVLTMIRPGVRLAPLVRIVRVGSSALDLKGN